MSKNQFKVHSTDRTLNERFEGMAANGSEEVEVEPEEAHTVRRPRGRGRGLMAPLEPNQLNISSANSVDQLRGSLQRTERNGSLESDMESVGTYRTVGDNCEDMSHLVNRYFTPITPKRTALPITNYEKQIMKAIHTSRVVVIEGATGCGKTTQVPQFIADDCAANRLPFNIVVTQPRRIAAKSIAARVAQERDWQLGSIVGYRIGMDKVFVSADTRLLYCTTGLLLQRLISTKRLEPFTHIVIDEIHERSIETDLLLLVIKKLMNERRASVRLVLMSATFDPQSLIAYFTIPTPEGVSTEPKYIKVVEKPHQLYVHYIRDIQNVDANGGKPKVSREALDLAVTIVERGLAEINEEGENCGSVLVFLPGIEDIYRLKEMLEKSKAEASRQWTIHVLHSSVPLDRQSAVFTKPNGRERKIILSTNMAESSITMPDVSYVIDFCLTKILVCDVKTNIPMLRMDWASKANCAQRAGRTGRVREGRVYRLVEKEFYENLKKFTTPELLRSPLGMAVLRVKMLRMGSPKELLGQALNAPDLRCISNSVLQLKHIGALEVNTTESGRVRYDKEDGDMTTLGQILSYLPIDVRLGKLIVFGHLFDVLEDCIIISACLSTEGIFWRDLDRRIDSYKSLLAWADRSLSDGITYLNAYKKYRQFRSHFRACPSIANDWCQKNFIQYQRIKEVDHIVSELISQLRRHNIQIPVRPNLSRNPYEDKLILKVVMCAAYYPNYFIRNAIDVNNIRNQFGAKDPLNSMLIEGLPRSEGPLYTHGIYELFSDASKQMDIEFHNSTACLTFLDHNYPLKTAINSHNPFGTEGSDWDSVPESASMSTGMSHNSSEYNFDYKKHLKDTTIGNGVYVAIAVKKFPEIRKQISIRNREEILESIIQSNPNVLIEDNSFGSSRVSVPYTKFKPRTKLPEPELPVPDCRHSLRKFRISVTHIVNPTHFYAKYTNVRAETFMRRVRSICTQCPPIPYQWERARIGDYVIAGYRNARKFIYESSCRARVERIAYGMNANNIQSITLFFIDYGFTQTVYKLNELKEIDSEAKQMLSRIPALAFQCSLAHVKPVAVKGWSKKSVKYFWKLTKNKYSLEAEIYSVVNNVVRVEMYDRFNQNGLHHNQLIRLGFAEECEESRASKSDNLARRIALLKANKMVGTDGSDKVIELEISFDSNDTTTDTIRYRSRYSLSGPKNALECSFSGLTPQTSTRTVRIMRDSVNWIVLEPNYLCKHSRLLVASTVGLGQNNYIINLRDTTLMPNIPDFPVLMALLFAPTYDLRDQYVSAICGLGYDESTLAPLDSEYEFEIKFDSEISREDVIKVDVIRHTISNALKSKERLNEYTEGSLAELQRKLRSNVIQLLSRRSPLR